MLLTYDIIESEGKRIQFLVSLMQLHEVIWKDRFIDKLEVKHGVSADEVEEILLASRMSVERKKVILREKIYILLTVRQRVEGIWLSSLSVRSKRRLCQFQPAT